MKFGAGFGLGNKGAIQFGISGSGYYLSTDIRRQNNGLIFFLASPLGNEQDFNLSFTLHYHVRNKSDESTK